MHISCASPTCISFVTFNRPVISDTDPQRLQKFPWPIYLINKCLRQHSESSALRLLLPPMAARYRFHGAVCAPHCTSAAALDVGKPGSTQPHRHMCDNAYATRWYLCWPMSSSCLLTPCCKAQQAFSLSHWLNVDALSHNRRYPHTLHHSNLQTLKPFRPLCW